MAGQPSYPFDNDGRLPRTCQGIAEIELRAIAEYG